MGYGVGSVSGKAFQDKVIVGDAVGSAQIIGSANFTQGFALVKPIDGISMSFASLSAPYSILFS